MKYKPSVPKWAITLGSKIDKFADTAVRMVEVIQVMRSMNRNRIKKNVKRLEKQNEYYNDLFPRYLYGEGTRPLVKRNDLTLGSYQRKVDNIHGRLLEVGLQAAKKGVFESYKKALKSILNQLRGTNDEQINFALEHFTEAFEDELYNVNIQPQALENEETIIEEIQTILASNKDVVNS